MKRPRAGAPSLSTFRQDVHGFHGWPDPQEGHGWAMSIARRPDAWKKTAGTNRPARKIDNRKEDPHERSGNRYAVCRGL